MRFNYKPEEVPLTPTSKRTTIVWRPIIPIILIKGKKLVGYEALMDSGADHNIFHGDLTEILGIKLTLGKSRKVYGLGGQSIKGYIHNLVIKPMGMEKYSAPVIFSKQMPEHSLGVLGNIGFFDKFKVTFDYEKKIIEVS